MCSTFLLDDGRRSARRGLPVAGLVSLALAACSFDEVSLGEGETPGDPGQGACALSASGVVEGEVRASTQAEINALAGCHEIAGQLQITASRDLDLAPLASLRLVRGTLRIQSADPSDAIEDLSGLEGLERVGELLLIGLDIQTLAPLSHLVEVRPDPLADPSPSIFTSSASIGITDCRRLVDLTGFDNLIVWDELYITDAPALQSLRGMVATRENQALYINRAPNLRDTAGFGHARVMSRIRLSGTGVEAFVLEEPLRLDYLELSSNPELVDLGDLQAIQSMRELVIRDNDRLEELPAVSYMLGLASLTIQDNDALRAVPQWIVPDEGDFLPVEEMGVPVPSWIPPQFALAEISGNPQLLELSLPTTFRFGVSVNIHDNASLTRIALPYLRSVDDLSIAGNASLTRVDVPVLERADDLHVMNNPVLAAAVFENVERYASEIEGNLDTAVP